MTETQDISSTTQKFLDIFDITNNVAVLRDGTVSMVLLISAMNFGLLAEQEQDAIMYAYAALLNSLNFPIQIVINSKTKDATSYLQLLEGQAQKATSENKRSLIKRYQNFVGQLIKERNVLDKKFYVVIPALPIEVGMIAPQHVLPGNQSPQITQEQKAAIIEKGIGVLEPRRDHLIAQFNRIGLYARQLATQEIIEIFYNNYNPEAYEGQQITDSQNYTTAMVNAGTTSPTTPLQKKIETALPEPVEPQVETLAEPATSEPPAIPTQPVVQSAEMPATPAPAPAPITQTPPANPVAPLPKTVTLPPIAEL